MRHTEWSQARIARHENESEGNIWESLQLLGVPSSTSFVHCMGGLCTSRHRQSDSPLIHHSEGNIWESSQLLGVPSSTSLCIAWVGFAQAGIGNPIRRSSTIPKATFRGTRVEKLMPGLTLSACICIGLVPKVDILRCTHMHY